ncbi:MULTISPECIES: transketolase [unclassified Anaerotruncus]|uniref:transketolase n=1 Tax=Anaerotruncus sp. 1XD42-93 TaxID=2320853 RepID=UPI0018F590F3
MNTLRKNIFLAAYSGGVGHLASAFSLVEILSALYLEDGVMRHRPQDPQWEGRDFLILSKGHGSLALYTVLCRAGYFPEEALWTFCQPDTMLGGEPNTLECPGVEASTGSLGHGLSIGVGMALALKSDHRPNHVYVIVGDGECQEGSIWEAAMSAPAFGLDNLTVIVDHNRIQKMDFIHKIMGQDALGAQFSAFGWQVKTCDGHSIPEIQSALTGQLEPGRPHCLIAQTVKGKGLSLMEDNPAWHWRMPGKKERKVFKAELGITDEELDAVRRET